MFNRREIYSIIYTKIIYCGTSVLGLRCGTLEITFDTLEAEFVKYGNDK